MTKRRPQSGLGRNHRNARMARPPLGRLCNIRAVSPESARGQELSELPWERPKAAAVPRAPHLVLVWSLDEPRRVGEATPISGPVTIGRGEPLSDDPSPRVTPRRMPPGASVDTGPFRE